MLPDVARRAWKGMERIAGDYGYVVHWRPSSVVHTGNLVPSDIEFAVPHLLLSKPRPFFLSIGANDGRHNDPLYPFIKLCHLPGIALEPVEGPFQDLARLHAGNPDVRCVNAALAAEDGEATLYVVEAGDGVFDRAAQFSSFRKDTLLSQTAYIPDVESRVVERRVPTVSFATLRGMALEMGAESIDIVQTDTEGFDGEVLRLMEGAGVEPMLINFEHLNMGKAEIEAHAARLTGMGYLFSMSDSDALAYRPPHRFTYRQADRMPPGL